ncbi:MAG: aspartate carbamoyltransferase regulatory subunit [Candidatus Micrarchaeota archaeon]|nr:aspartate carbamoyltransferase regulatory subunit [Candidatus Micrarchaeota archaeon]
MLKVDIIEHGTVVDHIQAGMGKKVLDILGIDEKSGNRVALVMNVTSSKMGKKDILKVEGVLISAEKTDAIALISPRATVNLIKDGKVVEKKQAELPEKLRGVGRCPNPNCISTQEKAPAKFHLEGQKYRCGYCERTFRPA